jgi:hypothetical protein
MRLPSLSYPTDWSPDHRPRPRNLPFSSPPVGTGPGQQLGPNAYGDALSPAESATAISAYGCTYPSRRARGRHRLASSRPRCSPQRPQAARHDADELLIGHSNRTAQELVFVADLTCRAARLAC